MPPRAQPKAYQILVKTHKLTIFLTVPHSNTIASLKEETLSALSADVTEIEDVPRVSKEEEFELCRAVKEKGKTMVQYEVLKPSQSVSNLTNWEVLYLQFKDEDGNLLPVEVEQPSLLDDEDEEPRTRSQATPSLDASMSSSPVNKGKRKAPPE